MANIESLRTRLSEGLVIPACPLALNARRKPDERRQRALFRYYRAAGAGGLAVGVHTTQFVIHDPKVGLLKPLLELGMEELNGSPPGRWKAPRTGSLERAALHLGIAGLCGATKQATAEAALAREIGWHAGLLSLAGHDNENEQQLLAHCRAVAEAIPLFGFYLQPAVGGRVLSREFWRSFAQIQNVVAIKIAPFNRYQTLDVVRGVVESGRADIALYTGNDDTIVMDLLTPFQFEAGGVMAERRMVGGLLGHWAVWTRKAVELHEECRRIAGARAAIPQELLQCAAAVTDANAAFFDASNGYAGCIPGLHEVLRRQGLLEGTWCLDPLEVLSPGQAKEIDRVYRAYPHLNDDAFVAEHRDHWLRG